jgi:hypothetical protein
MMSHQTLPEPDMLGIGADGALTRRTGRYVKVLGDLHGVYSDAAAYRAALDERGADHMAYRALSTMEALGVVPVVEVDEAAYAVPLARTLTRAGLQVVEFSLRKRAALDAVAEIRTSGAVDAR